MTNPETLATIRAAHRYVAAYQRRVLDAAAAFDEAIGITGLGYEPDTWETLYCDAPANKKFVPTRWSWDFLPLYAIRYYWMLGGRKENQSGSSFVMLDHVADTGFEKRKETKVEPDPLVDFPDVAECDSVLRARWIQLNEPVSAQLFDLEWDKLVPKHFGVPLEEVWPKAPTRAPTTREHGGVVAGGHVISISDFADRQDYERLFVSPVVAALRALRA